MWFQNLFVPYIGSESTQLNYFNNILMLLHFYWNSLTVLLLVSDCCLYWECDTYRFLKELVLLFLKKLISFFSYLYMVEIFSILQAHIVYITNITLLFLISLSKVYWLVLKFNLSIKRVEYYFFWIMMILVPVSWC